MSNFLNSKNKTEPLQRLSTLRSWCPSGRYTPCTLHTAILVARFSAVWLRGCRLTGEHLPLKHMWINCSPKQLRPAQVPTQQARALMPHAWRYLVLADFAFSPICEQKILLSHRFLKLSFFPEICWTLSFPLTPSFSSGFNFPSGFFFSLFTPTVLQRASVSLWLPFYLYLGSPVIVCFLHGTHGL